MIDDKTIEQVLDRADIVDIIGEYMTLKKKGVTYEGCCPFHNEKTPSFKVSPAKGIWKCFGCGKGGNVIGFVMEHESMSYPEAIKFIAGKYGITIEEEKLSPEEERKRKKHEAMYIVNEKVAEHFVQNMALPVADSARKYTIKRWGKEYMQEMGIGFALDKWDDLIEWAKANGISIEMLVELNLVKKRENGGMYDFYRNRIIIPIRDKYRRVIGFTARDMSGTDGTPKYLNSQESEIYSKTNSIFGIDIAIKQATNEDRFYLVEIGRAHV